MHYVSNMLAFKAPAPILRIHHWPKSYFVFSGSTGRSNLTRSRIGFKSNLTMCILKINALIICLCQTTFSSEVIYSLYIKRLN